jgi:hypothetical protein
MDTIGLLSANIISAAKNYNLPAIHKNNLNGPPPADENAILRLEVELRDKHVPAKKQGKNKVDLNVPNVDICMEKVSGDVVIEIGVRVLFSF